MLRPLAWLTAAALAVVASVLLSGCAMPTSASWVKGGPWSPDSKTVVEPTAYKPVAVGKRSVQKTIPPVRGVCENGVCKLPALKVAAVEK